MTAKSGFASAARTNSTEDVETLQTLIIFSGAGLLLSLLLGANGWI